MPATRRRFECGHRGLGGSCHRCAQAARLEAFAGAGGGLVFPKRLVTGMWTADQCRTEAERLRAP